MHIGSGANIGVLVLPQYSFAQLGQVLEPLFITNWLLGTERFRWQLLGMQGGAVPSAAGVPVDTAPVPEAAAGFDIIFVLASFETKTFAEDSHLKRWLHRAARDRVIVCGIEGGTEAMAAAGILDGRRATLHWDNFAGFRERYPAVDLCPELYVIDGRLMSCAGGTAVSDLMFHWLRPQVGKAIFRQLQDHLMEPRTRAGSVRQGLHDTEAAAEMHPSVRRAIELMKETVEDPVRVGDIAARLGISVRQLERRFRAEMQVAPSKYYLRIRIARAHRLLQQTDLSVAEIAATAGFQSLEHFSRVYRQYYGCPPSKDRLQTTGAPSIPREW